MVSLAAILPHDADWIWYMGDDDHFPGTNSLLKLCEFLRQHDTIKSSCSFMRVKLEGRRVQVKFAIVTF